MLDEVASRVSGRKLRLLACAACRGRAEHFLITEQNRLAVETAEGARMDWLSKHNWIWFEPMLTGRRGTQLVACR